MTDLPYPENDASTHWDDCWKHRGHHNCAVARCERLAEAAKAVIERWDSPLWKDLPHTAHFINRLRDALGEK